MWAEGHSVSLNWSMTKPNPNHGHLTNNDLLQKTFLKFKFNILKKLTILAFQVHPRQKRED